MSAPLWILGAADPEMEAIERLLREAGETIAYAMTGGIRVHPGNAYSLETDVAARLRAHDGTVYLVECGARPDPTGADRFGSAPEDGADGLSTEPRWVRIDHHAEGDPGFGVPPIAFERASSLGQVSLRLGSHLCDADRIIAAADHCLGAAYAGYCGVDPTALAAWRAKSRAAHQGRPVEALLADVARATAALESAKLLYLGPWVAVADLRWAEVPELPEAAVRLGRAYLATPRPGLDGRAKVVIGCASPEEVQAFFAWARLSGYVEAYGDPERGFAGAYWRKHGR